MTLFFFCSARRGVTLAVRHASLVKSLAAFAPKWRLRNLQGFAYAVVQPTEQTSVALVVQMWRFNGCQRRPAGRALDGEEVGWGWWSKGGTDMQRNGEMVMYRRYNKLHWNNCGFAESQPWQRERCRCIDFRVGKGVAYT